MQIFKIGVNRQKTADYGAKSEITMGSLPIIHYYRREDSRLEEDFFLRSRSNIVPIEVKATTGRSKSLRTLIDSGHYPDIAFGVKVVDGNLGFANNIYTVPHFCAFLIKDWLSRK